MTVLLPSGSILKTKNNGIRSYPCSFRSAACKLQEEVHEWIANHGVRYFNELTNMAQLTEEVGEVARIIARRYGEQSEKESDKAKDLGEELSDVLFVVLCLANQPAQTCKPLSTKK